MLRVALCQMAVSADKAANISRAAAAIATAVGRQQQQPALSSTDAKINTADLVVLPECFNCPYGTKYFADYAETIPPVGTQLTSSSTHADEGQSPTLAAIAEAAVANKVWVVAGSVPERDAAGKIYNSSVTVCPDGVIRGIHRKIHLFKIDTETVKFDESEVLTAGNTPTVVDLKRENTDAVRLGIGICFDVRYPQLAMYYQQQSTNVLVYPGAFNMVTGPKHWELAARSRAVDTQQFVIMCSPARDTSADYVAYGHSLVCDPWGQIIASAADGEETIVRAEINLDLIREAQKRLPISAGTRTDLYHLQWQKLGQ